MNIIPYNTIYIDITSICNARCPFCERGARRIGLLPKLPASKELFMTAEKFEKIFRHLLDKNIITDNCTVSLYNWGEPLINPYFIDIMKVIKYSKDFKGKLALSTNGGKKIIFSSDFMPAIPIQIVYTLPGFSQNSYDRGNKFNFKDTINNIISMAASLESLPNVLQILTFLAFKYNLHEISLAKSFANRFNLNLSVTVAYLNSLNLFFKYVDNDFNTQEIDFINSYLIMDHFDIIRAHRHLGYVCPQFSYLAISPSGEMNIGCCSRLDNRDDYFGDICSMDIYDTYMLRQNQEVCKKCQANKLDFVINEAPGMIRLC